MTASRALLLAAALALAAPAARAVGADPAQATPVQREQAQAIFLKGKQKYEAGDYKGALAGFQASIEIVQSPNARLYVARSYRELGQLVEAYVEFGRTVAEASEHAAADGRYAKASDAAKAERELVAAHLGFAAVTVEHPGAETKLVVGGNEIRRAGWTEPVPVMPGDVEVRVETPGRAPVTRVVRVEAGKRGAVTLDAGAEAAAEPAAADARSEKPAPSRTSAATVLRVSGIAAGGVGVVGLAMFAVAGPISLSTFGDLEKRCGKATPCPPALASEVDRGKTEQTVANVGLGLAVAGLAVGGALVVASLFVTAPREGAPAAASAAVRVGPGEVSVAGTF